MQNLLVVTALIEAFAGSAFIASPAFQVRLLLGATLDTPAGLVMSRVAGAAVLALSLACWRARKEERSGAARGVVAAMLLYNAMLVVVFLYAGLGLRLTGIGLWPTVGAHAVLGLWCVASLRVR
jgi:hypothetical protein